MSIFKMSSNMSVHLYADASIEASIDEHSQKVVFTFADKAPVGAITKVHFFMDAATLAKFVSATHLAEKALNQAIQRQNAVEYVRTDDRIKLFAGSVSNQQVAA